MKEHTGKLLGKADQSVSAADHLLKDGYAEFAASRAYYAMFYAAEALLSEKGRRFRKHGGVHAPFGKHFAKTGLMDPKFHRWLLDAFDKRVLGDYGVEEVLARGDAETLIRQAGEFLAATRQHLGSASCHRPAPKHDPRLTQTPSGTTTGRAGLPDAPRDF